MKKLLEKDIQKAVCDYLRAKGYFIWKQHNIGLKKPNGSFIPAGMLGVADILGVGPRGLFMAVEVKGPRGDLSEHQRLFLLTVRNKGGLAGMVRSVDDIEKLLKEWENGGNGSADKN